MDGKTIKNSSLAAPQFAEGVKTGVIENPELNEASGLAASRKNRGVLWAHNDSGDTGRLFALNTKGKNLGIYTLVGVNAVDCEDIAIGPGPTPAKDYLYLGDIGDNMAQRKDIMVYRVAEPTVSAAQAPATVKLTKVEKFRLQYEDGPRDAETLLVDPGNGDLYIISKRDAQPRIYRTAAANLKNGKISMLVYKTHISMFWPTAGDISPDGSEIAVRGYRDAELWRRLPGSALWEAFNKAPISIPLASEFQGEAIALTKSGYFTTSEGENPPIYFFRRILK
jgi:hypothetical protein